MLPNQSRVVKSKSSNIAITTKCDTKSGRHKTRSSAEFPPHGAKKRSVYVEKITKLNGNSEGKDSFLPEMVRKQHLAATPPARRDRKKFLTSVLSILSKCTTGTQYPDSLRIERNPNKVQVQKILEDKNTGTKIKKSKYKSKILNNGAYKENPLVVLKGKRDITQTPSNYSQRSYRTDSNRLLNTTPLTLSEAIKPREKHVEINADDISTIINEPEKEKKLHIKADPTTITLVSESKAKSENRLYNFFVDLLETTLNVYNVKEEVMGPVTMPSEVASRTFEIDEAVAKKLEILKEKRDSVQELNKQCCASKTYNVLDDNIMKKLSPSPKASKMTRFKSPISSISRPSPPAFRSTKSSISRSPTRSYKRMSSSFAHTQPLKVSPKTRRVDISKRSFQKKTKKETFLNILKDQLRMEAESFEEPQNLYEALKILARNKKRCRKSIKFDENVTYTAKDSPESECWKHRRVISRKNSIKKKPYLHNRNYHERVDMKSFRSNTIMSSLQTSRSNYSKSTIKSNNITDVDDCDTDSYHSLEIQEVNYESNTNRMQEQLNKEINYADLSNHNLETDFKPSHAMYNLVESMTSKIDHRKANPSVYRSISQIMFGDN